VLICAHDDVPATVVHSAVMGAAQKCQVRQIRCATVDPVDGVVRLSPCGRPPTAGETAPVIAGHQRPPLRRRNQTLLAPEVERCTVVIDDDSGQLAVTRDSTRAGRGDRSEPRHPAGRHRVWTEHCLVGTAVCLALWRRAVSRWHDAASRTTVAPAARHRKVLGTDEQRQVRPLSTLDGTLTTVQVAAKHLGEGAGPGSACPAGRPR